MEPQNEQGKNKETTTMTVVIPKSSRDKLGRLKGIYGCDSLACAVSSVIEDVAIPDLLRTVADRETSVQNETLLTYDQSKDETIDPVRSLYGKEENDMVEFCIGLKSKFNIETMVELNDLLAKGDIGIEYVDHRPERSHVGEMIEVPEWKE